MSLGVKGDPIYDFSALSKMRGCWLCLLVNSARADGSTREERITVCGQLRSLREYFPCLICKEHFTEYLLANPPETVIHKRDGLFDWVVDFANDISRKKGKLLYDREIIYPMFHSPQRMETCSSSCEGSEVNSSSFSLSSVRESRAIPSDISYNESDLRYRRQSSRQ